MRTTPGQGIAPTIAAPPICSSDGDSPLLTLLIMNIIASARKIANGRFCDYKSSYPISNTQFQRYSVYRQPNEMSVKSDTRDGYNHLVIFVLQFQEIYHREDKRDTRQAAGRAHSLKYQE